MNYTCLVIVQFELNFVGGQKRKGVKNMKKFVGFGNLQFYIDDSLDLYAFSYLNHLKSCLPDCRRQNIIKQLIVLQAMKDKDFYSFSDFLDKLCDNSEVNVNELFNMSNL